MTPDQEKESIQRLNKKRSMLVKMQRVKAYHFDRKEVHNTHTEVGFELRLRLQPACIMTIRSYYYLQSKTVRKQIPIYHQNNRTNEGYPEGKFCRYFKTRITLYTPSGLAHHLPYNQLVQLQVDKNKSNMATI